MICIVSKLVHVPLFILYSFEIVLAPVDQIVLFSRKSKKENRINLTRCVKDDQILDLQTGRAWPMKSQEFALTVWMK